MSRRPLYPLVDRLFDGQLADRLRGWREDGKSFPEIAYLLRREHDIPVSDETVRRWVNDLDPQPSKQAS